MDEPSSSQRRMKRPETFSILGQEPVGEQGREGWLWGHSLRGFPQSLGLEQPHKTHVDPFLWMRLLSSERRHNFPHSIVQEMESPSDEVTCPNPHNLYLCPRELDIQLFLQGYSLPSTAARCPYKRLYMSSLQDESLKPSSSYQVWD